MNVVREIERINRRELELGVSEAGSWHAEYRGSAYVFAGGLPPSLSEGDIICVFSQCGEVVDCNLVRDDETGRPKGFAFIAFEDQRSTVLAVDNFNGTKLLGRTVRVDHVHEYSVPKGKARRNADGSFAAAAGQDEDDQVRREYLERRRRVWDYEAFGREESEEEAAAAVAEEKAPAAQPSADDARANRVMEMLAARKRAAAAAAGEGGGGKRHKANDGKREEKRKKEKKKKSKKEKKKKKKKSKRQESCDSES